MFPPIRPRPMTPIFMALCYTDSTGGRTMKLGRLGVWYSTDKLNAAQLADFMKAIEKNGYSAFWHPESRGYEAMSLGSYLLSKTEKLVIGSSIANIYARDAFTARR